MMQANLCSSALACCCDTQRCTWKSRRFLLPSEFGRSHFQGNQVICGLLHSCFILYVRKPGYLQCCKGMQIVQVINTSLYVLAEAAIVVLWAAWSASENGFASGFCAICSHASSHQWSAGLAKCGERVCGGLFTRDSSSWESHLEFPSLLALSSGLLLCHHQARAPGCHS